MFIKEVYNKSHVTPILISCHLSELSSSCPWFPVASLAAILILTEVEPSLLTHQLNYSAEALLVTGRDLGALWCWGILQHTLQTRVEFPLSQGSM